MTTRVRETVRRSVAALAAAAFCLAAAASEPPDSELNPVTGKIETADTTADAGNSDVRFVTDPGGGHARSFLMVTVDPRDDLAPRLTVTGAGDAWVAWWRDDEIDQVLARKRTFATGSWSGEIAVGDPLEGGRRPEIVHDGSTAWVAYELDDVAGGTAVAVRAIHDDPDPIGVRQILDTTGYAGDLDLSITFTEGRLWVSWVDSQSEVGWSAYDSAGGAWQPTAYESYAADDVEQARERIRALVLAD